MRKSILSVLTCCLAFAAVPAFADLAPTVMLRHNNQSTMFNYYQVQDAVNAAAEGDTIYLSEGTFQPFNIDKRIMVRGAGPGSIIEGSCEIDISGAEKLSMPVLDAVTFLGDITVTQAPRQLTFRKCKIANLIFSDSEFHDVKINQCWITNRLNLPSNVKEFNADNSKIRVLYPHNYENGQVNFRHCNIVEICAPITGAHFISCRIQCCTSLSNQVYNANLIACELNSCTILWANPTKNQTTGSSYNDVSGDEQTQRINCISLASSTSATGMEYKNTSHISAEDGTYVGAYGGQHPFTQYPDVPGVTQHQITIDAATKTMTVKLTVDKLNKQE